MTPTFNGSANVAMKIPHADYDATLTFYRDVLGLPVVKEDASGTPTVSETHAVKFGPMTLWLDRVDTYSQTDLWLELHTDDVDAATAKLGATGIATCDEIEPFTDDASRRSHWIKIPAGVVHHLASRSAEASPG
jgi:catechol 2,3-dioxygenase-like lactoylglutathione lyase family enzyme